MRYFTYMHRIFLPRIGESSKCQMLLNIVAIKTDDSEGGTEEVIKTLSQSVENQWATMVQLNLLTLLLEDLFDLCNRQISCTQNERCLRRACGK